MAASASILVVDDEDSIRHFVSRSLKDEGYQVRSAGSGEEARSLFNEETPELVVLDMQLGDANGLDLLGEFKRTSPDTVVIVITAFGETETAVRAMSEGAFYFLKKPLQLDELNTIVGRGLDMRQINREVEHLRQAAMQEEGYMRCVSRAMTDLYKNVDMVAKGDVTSVLVEGESGSGKEMIARLIHQESERAGKAFVELNCAAIPRDLLESELFGHEKGAFTDARAQKQGLLELAHGGTLFLDEIAEMPVQLQVKMLRVLERMTFKRVGGVKDIQVSVRVVSATNQDLGRLVQNGGFREDLYYRLNVVALRVPPLRERHEDIMPLAGHFRERFNVAFKKNFLSFAPDADEMIRSYPWPGNVRELRNVMERTILLHRDNEVRAEYLQLGEHPRGGREVQTIGGQLDAILQAAAFPEGGIDFEKLVEEVERQLILKAYHLTDENQSRTAEVLNVKRDKLRYRMKQFGIKDEEPTSHVG
ncbi:MAG: sigma-54-dependent transcriptional regulator [Candidatus Eiseniibacteriota bacterium]